MTETTTDAAPRLYAGADWVKEMFHIEPSPLGSAVADLLGDLAFGIYHLNPRSLRKVEWADPYVIIFNLDHHTLANFDPDGLTRLVVLSHDRLLRVQVKGKAPSIVELMFHQRDVREGPMSHRLPTIETAVARIRADYVGKPAD